MATPKSRSRSRDNTPHSLVSYGPESLMSPDSTIIQDTAELIEELIHPHNHRSETLGEQEGASENYVPEDELKHRRQLSWWKRPSTTWLLVMIPFIMGATAATIAPRLEVITQLVCNTLRPEYNAGSDRSMNTFMQMDMKQCSSDPVVQAAAARFLIVMTTTTGALSCITAGWWGSRSDRKGRVATMKICLLGLLATDIGFIYVYDFLGDVYGSYWLLLVGPIIEGFLGGFSAGLANMHAYIADCTEPEKRSRYFSRFLGLMFCGVAVGPALGSLVIRSTQKVIAVFYFATAIHVLYVFLVWFIVPESLFPSQLRRNLAVYKTQASNSNLFSIRRLFRFLAPLRLFLPSQTTSNNPMKRKRDWNLTLLAAAYCFNIMMIGSYPYKFQYASLVFGWDSEALGYWMSVVGTARATFLTLILPTIIALFTRKSKARFRQASVSSIASRSEAHIITVSPETESLLPPDNSTREHRHHSPVFDLNVGRFALVVEATAYVLMSFAGTGPVFTVWTIMGSCGAGFVPAVQSLSLALYGGTESGSLFGALSVVNAVGSQLISPTLFGFTYSATVGTFPQAIFLASAGALTCSLVLISFVRLPKTEARDEEDTPHDVEHLLGETMADSVAGTVPKISVTDDDSQLI